jgi:EmrB/QacA subfamily drug resistance transporter
VAPNGSAAPRTRREVLVAFAAIMLATLLAALDQTIVATALPRIASDLGAFGQLSWVVTAYLLASTITIPLYGKLSDLFGRRSLFVVAISLFLAGSALCGAATSVGQLIGFRVLQGLGAGGLLPLSQAAIGDLFSPRERGRYQGFVGSMWATAAIGGPLLGGVLTDHASWRWIFLLNLPLGAAALAVVVRTMPTARHPRPEQRVDWAGAVLLGASTVALLLACTWGAGDSWTAPHVLAAAAVGIVALVLFLAVERRAAEPLLPRALFRSPVPRVTTAGAVVSGAVIFGLTIYVPVYVQGAQGRSATTAGTVLIPFMLAWVTAAFVSGQLVSRWGRYRVFPVIGGACVLAGTAGLALVGSSRSAAAVAGVLLVAGLGMGMTWPVYMVAIQNAMPWRQLGAGTASLLFFRALAGSLAVAGLGAVLNARLASELDSRLGERAGRVDIGRLIDGTAGAGRDVATATHEAVAASLHTVFLLMVPLAAAMLLLALALKELPLRRQTPSESAAADGLSV